MQKIADGLYTFKGLWIGRVYATDDEDGGLTIIDASISSAAPKIERQLREADPSWRICATYSIITLHYAMI